MSPADTNAGGDTTPTGARWRLAGPEDPAVLAAVTAAVNAMWPRAAAPEPEDSGPSRWRFSARWWARGRATPRRRPYTR